jgi:HAD superfamily hydrolase (TIGR01509 family)
MLRAVLFDLDGTLVNSEAQNAESVARVLAQRGRPLSDEEREFVIGHGWAEIHHHLVSHGGIYLPLEELMRLAAHERELLVQSEGMEVLPGAVDTVRRVTGRYASAVVSGSSRGEVRMCLEALGVLECFPWFLGAEDTARGKPYPDGYLLAAERLAVHPAECLVIEDSTAGIRAGRAAGMSVVAVRAGNFAKQPQEDAHVILDTLEQLDDALLAQISEGAYLSRENRRP